MPRELSTYFEDILVSISKIERYTNGMSKESFKQNEMVMDAVVRNLEVIGEAVKKIPEDIKLEYDTVSWRKIAGLRDILIHEYFGVNINIIWDVIENKVHELKSVVSELFDRYG